MSSFRHPILALACSLALGGALPAWAQATAPSVMLLAAAPATGALEQRVQVSPLPGPAATPQTAGMRDLQATYALSNGRRLSVSSLGDALRVRYGLHRGTTLRFDGQDRYVSADGQLSLQLTLDDFGDPQHVRLTMPAAWL